jgi:hypothetical protein
MGSGSGRAVGDDDTDGRLGLRGEVLDEVCGDFGEEAGGLMGADAIPGMAEAGAGEEEALSGAGDTDVAEAAFLFEGGRGYSAVVGQEIFIEAGEEDDGELQAFSGMEGHEGNGGVGVAVGTGIGARCQGGGIKENGEGITAFFGLGSDE